MKFKCTLEHLTKKSVSKKSKTKKKVKSVNNINTLSNISWKNSISSNKFEEYNYQFNYLLNVIVLKKKRKNFISLVTRDFYKVDYDRIFSFVCSITGGVKYTETNRKKTYNEIRRLMKRPERFILIHFFIKLYKSGKGHINMIIFDTEKKLVYHFEPYGFIQSYPNCENRIKIFFENFDPDITYINPRSFLPEMAFQHISEVDQSTSHKMLKKKDPFGFCHYWCLFFTNLVLKFPDKNISDITKQSMHIIAKQSLKTNLTRSIRNYSQYIERETNIIIKKILKDNNIHNYYTLSRPEKNNILLKLMYDKYIKTFNYT